MMLNNIKKATADKAYTILLFRACIHHRFHVRSELLFPAIGPRLLFIAVEGDLRDAT